MLKPLTSLTLDDLCDTAVWRVEDHGGVEMAVPVEAGEIATDSDDLLIARTRFKLANGRTFVGYCAPGDWGINFSPPVIIHQGRQLPLFDDLGGPLADWAALAPTPDQAFPVTAAPEVRVDGRLVTRRYDPDGADPDTRPSMLKRFGQRVLKVLDYFGRDY